MTLDLTSLAERRRNGETWKAIADAVSIPESTLRGRLRIAGLLPPKRVRGKRVATVSAPAAAPATPTASSSFVPPAWYPALRYARMNASDSSVNRSVNVL